MPLARAGARRRIWGEHDVALGNDEDTEMKHSSVFFVGTRKEYRAARHLPPHLAPFLTGEPRD